MAYFIKVRQDSLGSAKYANIDAVEAIAEGRYGGSAKLYMHSGDIYESLCSFEEVLRILQSRGLLEAE